MDEATARLLVAAYLGCTTLDSADLDLTLDLSLRSIPSQFIFLDAPLTALTTLTLDGSVITHMSTLPVWELQLSSLYTSGSVRIVGKTGWTPETLPAQIKAAVDLTVSHYGSQTPGVKSEAIGRRSVTYQDASDSSGLPAVAEKLLAPYRRLML